LPVAHYENFPVASWLLPARLRPPIEAIYGFARSADDIADEGDRSDAERLAALERYLDALDAIESRGDALTGASPMRRHLPEEFLAIGQAVAQYDLPVPLLRDLIDAFRQDAVKKRYVDYAELRDYARRSANPVGRLVLHLFDRFGPKRAGQRVPLRSVEARGWSDAICSALQFINFWQDVALDWKQGRVYIPQEDLRRFDVSERQIAEARVDAKWRALMAFECARARELLLSGAPLGRALPGRFGLEIRATVYGGLCILDKIDAVSGDVFRHRPVLTPFDWVGILARSL
jgi:squalene synthase HpnC